MELHLFILLFLTGGVPLALSIPREYYLIQQEKTWSEAQAYCRSKGTDLATIETADDMNRLQAEAQKHNLNSKAWTGLWNDVNSWRWSFANKPLESWTDWGSREPNNGGGHEECAATNQWAWFDIPCAARFPFTCFTENFTGTQRFTYYSNVSTWSEAQTFCRLDHTDLASARDSTENSLLQQYLTSLAGTSGTVMNTWFGLFRDSWKWSDQTVFSTITWKSGQPDNYNQSNENCGYIFNGQAGDAPCSGIKPFFCYNVITRQQQILRVKVQSDQDVNDPAVKAAIMEQIKQKLRDRGMENAKVKGREQPGGVVFHKMKEENTTDALNTTSESCKCYKLTGPYFF